MAKRTRYDFQVANLLGTPYAVSSNTTLSADNILQDGYQFIILSDGAQLTLPSPSIDLWGMTVRVFTSGHGFVVASDGFGGRGGSFDTVQNSDGETCDFWCGRDENGSYYWYAITDNVTASGVSSSSSSSSSSLSSSSSSSSSG